MKYMMLIYGNKELWESLPAEQWSEVVAGHDALNAELFDSGELVAAYGVDDQDAARTVQVVDGTPVVSDGPYLETKEYLGSFSILDCESMERALQIAAGFPTATFQRIEVRPLTHEGTPPE